MPGVRGATSPRSDPLVGRDAERRALDAVVSAARAGEASALLVVGEPGIGKTVLLDDAAERAGGVTVLRAQGVTAEMRVPFAGLLALVRPIVGELVRLPAAQAETLAGALALGPARSHDRFAISVAALALLAECAEARPVLLLVDDLQWLDESSAGVVLFVVRRLAGDRVGAVLAGRVGECGPFEESGLPALHLGGLDRDAAAALVRRGGGPAGHELLDQLYTATGGNPLALLELAGEDWLAAGVPVASAPVPLSARLASAFLGRYRALPEPTRRALLAVATADADRPETLAEATSALGASLADLEPAEEAGLIAVAGGRIAFRHPLVRSAIYTDASGPERRAVHRALAAALPAGEVERRAWHLGEAAVGPDAAAADALATAAVRAAERSAYAVASSLFERAASLSVGGTPRTELLYAAAQSAWSAGVGARSLTLLEEARLHAGDGPAVARVDQLRGHVVTRLGRVAEGHALLVAAAGRAAPRDVDTAIVMLAEAVNAAFYAGDTTGMRNAAALVEDLVPASADGEAAFFAAMATGMASIFAGHPGDGAARIRRAIAILEASDTLRTDPRLLAWVVFGPLWLRDAAGRELVERAVQTARKASALGVLPHVLSHVGYDQAGAGAWVEARAAFAEAIALADETGQAADRAFALAGLARLEARRGADESCRACATAARELAAELGAGLVGVWTAAALGDFELGRGRPAEALPHLREQEAMLAALDIRDVDISPAVEIIEALARLGRVDDAAARLGAVEEAARAKGQPWALARALRCRGMLTHGKAADAAFASALALHAQTPDVFEAAKTRLAYGAHLRRTRRRARARVELRAAIEAFDRLGAAPWFELARIELAASGVTARRRDPSTLDDLTRQELQVALHVTRGQTTREAAAALFLSPKTIEFHLRNAYRKLGIRSRDELAAALAPHEWAPRDADYDLHP